MPNIVDRFNVEGQEYYLEPPMDAVPTQGSHNAVQSGGVYDALAGIAISPTPAQGETKAFSTGGAYDYFQTANSKEWLIRVFAYKLGQKWVRSESSEAAGYDFADTCVTENGVFFTVLNKTLMKSLDGMNWEATSLTGLRQAQVCSAIYFKGIYIVSLPSGTYASEDLNTFTLVLNEWFYDYCNTGDILIVSVGTMKYTTDGTSWHNCTITGGGGIIGGKIAYFNGVFVIQPSSTGNTVFTSSDGMAYTHISYHSSSLKSRGLVSTPVGFFAAGANASDSRIYTSVDGANWIDTGYTRLYKSDTGAAQNALLSAGNLLYVSTTEAAGHGSDVLFVDNTNVILGPTLVNGAPRPVSDTSIQPGYKVKYMDGVYLSVGGYSYNKISTDGVNFTRFYPTNVYGRAALYHGTLVNGGYYSSVFDPRCL